ncbi:hypothetical protein HQ560_20245 [bacterium]|nr:hypothetical protein [bacterium]
MRRKILLWTGIALIPALALTAWFTWPESPPPPSTADEVMAAIQGIDLDTVSNEALVDWGERVASSLQRLPSHQLQKFVGMAIANPSLRARFEKLTPEQRQRLEGVMSEEQRVRMMAGMAQGFVTTMKAMPAFARNAALRAMHERRKTHEGKSGHPPMTPKKMAQWQAASTPTERAKFVRAMRDMRVMAREAGISR